MNGVYNMNFSAGNARELIDGRFLEHEKLVHRVMGSKKLMKDLEDAAGLMKMTLLSGNKISPSIRHPPYAASATMLS